MAAVKNWTFIGRSLKKYLYGIRLINWRAESYRAKCELHTIERTVVTNSVDIFSYSRSHISPIFFFGFTKKVSKIQQHFILWFRAVSFYKSRLSWGSFDKTHAYKFAQPIPRKHPTRPLLSLYVSLFMIFIHLFGLFRIVFVVFAYQEVISQYRRAESLNIFCSLPRPRPIHKKIGIYGTIKL